MPRIWWTTLPLSERFPPRSDDTDGLFGTERPLNNFSLTFFWIGFVLGFAYLTALVGDIYEFVNPWRVMCDVIEQFHPMNSRGAFGIRDGLPTTRSLPLHGFHLA